ncbi:hypothetical protein H5410_005993 [Solanum commersonii]|uniref:Uncharacterized protein n=1 Tax=Solanum commersonii TaxID=4109 RepID=A0A9J6A9Y0_SOLCO|nr:hypothetical protein H5410_005993 [Solanum commersonii]
MEFHRQRRREDHLVATPSTGDPRPPLAKKQQRPPLSSPTLLLQQLHPLYSPAKKSTMSATTNISGNILPPCPVSSDESDKESEGDENGKFDKESEGDEE